MAQHANVNSIESIKAFRSHLVTYVSKAAAALDEVQEEVRRTRFWLEGEQRSHWEGEVRRCERALDEAQQALLSAKLSGLRDSTNVEQFAVNRAKVALRDAEEKRARVRKWGQLYGSRVESMVKGLSGLRNSLDHDMPKAILSLDQTVDHLEAYKTVARPSATSPNRAPGSEESGGAA